MKDNVKITTMEELVSYIKNIINCQEDKIQIESIRIKKQETQIKVEAQKSYNITEEELKIAYDKIIKRMQDSNIYVYDVNKHWSDSVMLKYYTGEITFTKLTQKEGSIEMSINLNKQMMSAVKAMCRDAVCYTCEQQLQEFKTLFNKEVSQLKTETQDIKDNFKLID